MLASLFLLLAALPATDAGISPEQAGAEELAERTRGVQVMIAVDANAVIGLSDENDATTGFSVDPRVGLQIDLGAGLLLTPEVMGSFARFGKAERISLDSPPDHTAFRALGGLRLAWAGDFQPAVFAHGGLGRRDPGRGHELGASFDAGAALEYAGLGVLRVGIQASWNAIALSPLFDWVGIGIHGGLVF
ncbi:MAG TPA: hypothetical protein VN033_11960 [Vulgatibacter sp.]|nr:hypothetical protein [Vulgatibacter sp.]